jgi:CRP-like cAMP-binding protein
LWYKETSMPAPPASTEILGFLRQVDLFQDLDESNLHSVAQVGLLHRLEEDEFLYYQGDPAMHLHVVLAGSLKLVQINPEGQQVLMRYARSGEAFAILAVLADMPFPTSAQAVEASLVMGWDQQTMRDLMLRHASIAMRALEVLVQHTREFQERIRELSTERVERRIARAVIRLARQSGRKVHEGVLVDLPVSRQDLAEMSGTTLFTVSRTLSQWESQGIIKTGREKIIILVPHELVIIAEDLPPGLAQDGFADVK